MTLFDEAPPRDEPRARRRAGGIVAGSWALSVALVAMLVLTFLPTNYVIQQPGPVYNTLGEATTSDGESVPLITVDGAETFETSGSLDLLTVQVRGNREHRPSWLDLTVAWFDRRKAVVPLDLVFPDGLSSEERNQQSAADMISSQDAATAAALLELGYEVGSIVSVYSFVEDAAARGVLEEDDVVLAANGRPIADAAVLREIVQNSDGVPIEIDIERHGTPQRVTVTPAQRLVEGEQRWMLGVILSTEFTFPFDVDIRLDDVGGPSAGMMFALGIIDTLTPGMLNGGERVAGSGTISADGTVGPIGGIRQKMWGAIDAGATWFLASTHNCDEVVGHVPDGLQVFSVDTLDDALDVLAAARGEADLEALPSCPAG